MKIRFGRNDIIDTKEVEKVVEDSKEETQTTSGGTQEQ